MTLNPSIPEQRKEKGVDTSDVLTRMDLHSLQARPVVSSLALACVVWVCYLFGLAIYRLCLSPIAKFPGPKLAALTGWYECYYDVVLNGKFTFHIQDLHKIYGRISFLIETPATLTLRVSRSLNPN